MNSAHWVAPASLGALFPATTALITVVLQVDADFAGATLINRASVAADQPDPNPANNMAETSTPVRSDTDLSVAKVGLPDPVIVGETLLYQIVITNSGPSAAHNVVISDTLDPNTYFAGADPSCTHDGSAPGGVVTCALNTLPANSTTRDPAPSPGRSQLDHRYCLIQPGNGDEQHAGYQPSQQRGQRKHASLSGHDHSGGFGDCQDGDANHGHRRGIGYLHAGDYELTALARPTTSMW